MGDQSKVPVPGPVTLTRAQLWKAFQKVWNEYCTAFERANFARDAAMAEAREKLSPETFKLLTGETK
mgnify:CR=1 FL=1